MSSDILTNPQSRNEAILQNMLGAHNDLVPPQSRIEELLLMLLEQGIGGLNYIGVTTTELEDGDNTNPIVINGEDVTAEVGDYCTYGNKEFIFNGSIWQELGDITDLTASMVAYDNTSSGLNADDVQEAIDEAYSVNRNSYRHTMRNITTDLTNLVQAVSEQNLEKYGYSIGDYFVGASTYKYYLADYDTFYSGYNDNAFVNTHHIGLLVDTGEGVSWNGTNTTATGYAGSDIHAYLSSTVLDNIKTDFIALFGGSTGLEHLIAHKLYWTITNSSSSFSDNDEYISLITETQVNGVKQVTPSSSSTDGEAWKPLDISRKYLINEIAGDNNVWTRNIYSSTSPLYIASDRGMVVGQGATYKNRTIALILFH